MTKGKLLVTLALTTAFGLAGIGTAHADATVNASSTPAASSKPKAEKKPAKLHCVAVSRPMSGNSKSPKYDATVSMKCKRVASR